MSHVLQFPTERTRRPEPSAPRAEATSELANRPGLGRGVWRLPFRVDGRPCLVAVDAAGEQIARVVVGNGLDEEEVGVLLQQLLDANAVAPAPRLQLVR